MPTPRLKRTLGATLAGVLWSLSIGAGPPAESTVEVSRADASRLRVFEGRYAYRSGPIDVLAHQGRLYAVAEDVAYPLQAAGGDRFKNGAGQPVEFLRDERGRVVAVREGRDRFERLTPVVSAAARALLVPRTGGPYRYRPPAQLSDGLAVGSTGRETLSARAAALIIDGVTSGRYSQVHSVLVHHRGRLILEEYFHGFDRDRPHQMRSLTKGVIALVAGTAVDRGLVSISDAALVPLVADPARLSDVHRSVTLDDLLAMRSRLSCDDERNSAAVNNDTLYGRADWIEAFVSAPAKKPSDPEAVYCSAGMLAAGRFLEVRLGSTIADLARQNLFRPMGIADGHWSWPFVLGAAGGDEFGQIRLRPRDMMKLGVMMLQGGRFNGRQVLSPGWIDAMTTRHSVIDGDGYGYGLWFRDYAVPTPKGARTVSTFMLSGNGGQKIYVIPSLALVVVATGGSYNQGNAPINAIMVEAILPAILAAEAGR
jgi:CubicO group peptidase (beta-lactamase class C family)